MATLHEQNEKSWTYPGWRVVAAAAGGVFFSFASLLVYTFGVFLKPIAAEFHWSRQAVSLAFGVAALCIAVCSPLLGMLLDRVPPRRILLPCFLIFGIAFASLSLLTNHLWHLYLVFVALGAVGNGTAHLAYSGALSTYRYNLAISASIRNLLNHNNPGPIIGNITSPLFGLANQPYGVGSLA
jgi:MFS-type transporter involved in bile tolerance (Atg22 family)